MENTLATCICDPSHLVGCLDEETKYLHQLQMLYANFGLERAINYLWQKMQTDTKRAPFPLSHFKILKLVENNYYAKQNRMVK